MLASPAVPYFTAEHEDFRRTLRAFVAREITPYAHAWDEAGEFPRDLYRKAAQIGLIGLGYPEAYGGTPTDTFMGIVAAEELAMAGCGGLQASLGSHGIAIPPIIAAGSAYLKQKVLPPVIAGDKIAALAITEPGGGSDVAALRTTAVADGDMFRVDGEKLYITSGVRADFLTVAVRTEPASRGASGLSLLLIDADTPGITRTPLKKMGWWASDTAAIHFNDCHVPAVNLIGELHQGFKLIMRNFNNERLLMAVMAVAYAQVCFDDALSWARDRHTFGAALIERQVIRHKLVDMQQQIQTARALVYELAWQIEQAAQGHHVADPAVLVGRTCLAKNAATQAMQFCADQAIQILGGAGFMRGSRAERVYRDVKVMMIGGGAEEIMKDLAARQFGF